jgi:hypothetical protein
LQDTVQGTLAQLTANIPAGSGASPLYLISFGGETAGGASWDTMLSSASMAATFGSNAAALVNALAAAYPGAAFGIDLDIEGQTSQLPEMKTLVAAFRAAAPAAFLQLCSYSGAALPGSADAVKVSIMQTLGPAQGGFDMLNLMVDSVYDPCSTYFGWWNAAGLAFLPLSARMGGIWGEQQPGWTLSAATDPSCDAGLFPWMKSGGVSIGIWQHWTGGTPNILALTKAIAAGPPATASATPSRAAPASASASPASRSASQSPASRSASPVRPSAAKPPAQLFLSYYSGVSPSVRFGANCFCESGRTRRQERRAHARILSHAAAPFPRRLWAPLA